MRALVTGTLCIAILVAGLSHAGEPRYKVTREDVARMSPPMQETFAGLQYLMNAYQMRQFINLPDDEARVRWIDQFWLLKDPTPTTPKNEMRQEHNIRVRLARQFYRSPKWPGWDKRGEVFVRYGLPDYRGKIWGEVTVNRGVQPPGELWYYLRHNMLVSFQNFGLKGEFIYSIDPLGAAENISPELAEFLLYDTENSLSKRIPQNLLESYAAEPFLEVDNVRGTFYPDREQEYLMSRERELPDDIDAIMDPDRIDMLPKDVSAVFQKERIREVANNFEIVLSETPSSYPFNFEQRELPFYFGVDQFRAGERANRVDVQVEIPVAVEAESGASFEETFHAEAVIWDAQFTEVARAGRDVILRSGPEASRWAKLLPTQLVFSLDPGYYRMAVEVRSAVSGRSSSFRTSFDCEPFWPSLAVSDILFARRIAPSDQPTIFTRGPLEVVPHPLRAYSRTVPMPVYFEVYNLTADSRGGASYAVEYKIIPHETEKKKFWERYQAGAPVISSRFSSSTFGTSSVEHITIDTRNLAKGSYDLLITVTDETSQLVAFQRGTFSLVD